MFEGVWRPLWFASPQRDQGRPVPVLIVIVILRVRVVVVLLLPVPDGITKAVLEWSRGREEEEDVT